MTRSAPLITGLLCGAFLFCCAYPGSVTRTQEARVLETAREMLGQPFYGWMVPHTNGDVRLRKPPLAYWLSAASFKVFGVSGWAGRVPAVLAAWGTLIVTFLIGGRLFNERVAWLASGALLGSFLFMRYMLVGETDPLATVFIVSGIYAAIRSFDTERLFRWQHFMAACMALAILSKGPGAAFVFLYLLAQCAITRRGQPLRNFFISGAPLTLWAIALPWFIYIKLYAPAARLAEDLANSAGGGEGHAGSPIKYVPLLLTALLPWSVAVIVALYASVGEAFTLTRADGEARRRLRLNATPDAPAVLTVLLWFAAIAAPLMIWGNKQIHYLLPLMPPMMILLAWAIDRSIDWPTNGSTNQPIHSNPPRRAWPWIRGIGIAMFYLLLFVPIGGLIAAKIVRGHAELTDWIFFVFSALISLGALSMRRAAPLVRWGCITALSMSAMFAATIWAATFSKSTPDDVVKILRSEFPDADFVFCGPEHLPTCFALRRIVPVLDDAQLAERAKAGRLVCLERASVKDGVTPIAGFRQVRRIDDGANFLSVSVPVPP